MDLRVTEATGTAERETALEMLSEHVGTRATVGADKGYDTRSFVAESRAIGVTPHVAKNNTPGDDPRSTAAPLGTRATASVRPFG